MNIIPAIFRHSNGGFPALPGEAGGLGISSPWAEGSLNRVILSQLIGLDTTYDQPSRELAQTVPGVLAGENLLHQTIGSLPLRAFNRDGTLAAKQPTWLDRTSDVFQSAYLRNCRILSDLYYVGYSLVEVVERGADSYPLDLLHVPIGGADGWRTEVQGTKRVVLIRGKVAPEGTYAFIQSAHPGLINAGWRTIAHALDLEDTIKARSENPSPLIKLQETDQAANLTDDEIDEYLDTYAAARRAKGGANVYVPFGTDLVPLDLPDGSNQFLLDARNAVISDIAKLTGIPSGLLEGTSSIDSMTYTTERGQRSRFVDFSLRGWLDPIQSRLSLGDITPNGISIKFDLTELLDAPSRTGLDAPETNDPNALPAPRTERVEPTEEAA
ncbi:MULTISPECIES: phage portal protein [Microbacterium]|uniref:Phage portal protein n=1 Tax=Microbacterium oxydans TaxID=82380 RepID=A0A3S9WIS5_9MICO|nr:MULTISPECIES: phage portal protein [Microbacterium]AZS39986.1 hypothetical protein CVS54_01304 [Microbacterium oxydans]KKX97194.1 hypothetical protein AAY78_14550 [Microbacterium sp. Ag1]